MAKRYEIDMINGPLFGKIVLYTLPLIAAGILQLLFNTADMVVVGRYAGSNALGGVGATASLINLLINVFMGLSVGANVAIAHYYGAGRFEELSRSMHTAISLSIICGCILLVIGQLFSEPMLILMGTPKDILPLSVSYMKIYFCGMPVMLLYNFGAAILRAVGDTKRPLYYLSLAGVINIILNLIFVIRFSMGVRGVAWATNISQAVSAVLIIRCLIKNEGPCRLSLSKLCLDKKETSRIAKVGLPAGFQGAIFSISNVLIQSSVNSFGAIAVAGNTATCNLEGFVYNSMNSFHQTAISFTGQNMGAKNMKRVQRVLLICLLCVTATGLGMGLIGFAFGSELLGIYSTDPAVIAFGLRRMAIIFPTYFLCGVMDVMVGSLRGMGFSIMPMTVSLLGACVFRIIWIMTVFAINHTPEFLYVSYPISWFITAAVHLICIFTIARRKYAHA
ncbi:MAG: MATE family efflux transporter [Lachnospiraceae bacterium]|nr:MATE family efflux transporter [Lachnospiraceae bacterium]